MDGHKTEQASDFLSLQDLSARYDVHSKTILNWTESGVFPQPLRFSRRFLRWRRADIEEFESRRISGE
jgi:predicted DNA-binding transcriptional regulator AlpA